MKRKTESEDKAVRPASVEDKAQPKPPAEKSGEKTPKAK